MLRPSFSLAVMLLAICAAGIGAQTTGPQSEGASEPVLTDHYAAINGIKMHYVTAGKGPLILFLHGFPEFWYEWKNQLLEFGRDHLAVAPDLRGYNLTEKPAGLDAYQMNNLVEDVRALAVNLGAKKFVLVGHDWGGVVAWSFAMAHPDDLEKLIVINAPHPAVFARELASNPAQGKASAYMLTFRSPQAETLLSADNYSPLVNIVLGEGLKNGAFTEEDKAAYIQAWSQPGALTGGLNYYRAARVGPPPKPRDDGAAAPTREPADVDRFTVRVPTLVIWGEKDTALLTGNLDGLEKYVPRLTIKRIPDGSHWVVHEKPAEVNAGIRSFLAQ